MKTIKGGTFELTKNQNYIYSLGAGKKVYKYDTRDFSICEIYEGLNHSSEIALSYDEKMLAIKNTSGKIKLINLCDGSEITKFNMEREGGRDILFSPDDKFIIDADMNGNIMLADIKNGKHEIILKIKGSIATGILYNPYINSYIFRVTKKEKELAILWKYPFIKDNYKIFYLPEENLGLSNLIYSYCKEQYIISKYQYLYFFNTNFELIDINEIEEGSIEQYFINADKVQVDNLLLALNDIGATKYLLELGKFINKYELGKSINDDNIINDIEDILDDCEDLRYLSIEYVKNSLINSSF